MQRLELKQQRLRQAQAAGRGKQVQHAEPQHDEPQQIEQQQHDAQQQHDEQQEQEQYGT
jgi:hypothetical protein